MGGNETPTLIGIWTGIAWIRSRKVRNRVRLRPRARIRSTQIEYVPVPPPLDWMLKPFPQPMRMPTLVTLRRVRSVVQIENRSGGGSEILTVPDDYSSRTHRGEIGIAAVHSLDAPEWRSDPGSTRTSSGVDAAIGCRILPRSMLVRSSQVRTLIALLLACAVPFCCCNLRMLIAGLSCQAGALPQYKPGGARLLATADHMEATLACCHGRSASNVTHSDSNSEDTPTDDPQDCSCGNAGGKMLAVEKSNVEVPVQVIVAVIDWSHRPQPRPHDLTGGRWRVPEAVPRPLTSLVRMHCALIV